MVNTYCYHGKHNWFDGLSRYTMPKLYRYNCHKLTCRVLRWWPRHVHRPSVCRWLRCSTGQFGRWSGFARFRTNDPCTDIETKRMNQLHKQAICFMWLAQYHTSFTSQAMKLAATTYIKCFWFTYLHDQKMGLRIPYYKYSMSPHHVTSFLCWIQYE